MAQSNQNYIRIKIAALKSELKRKDVEKKELRERLAAYEAQLEYDEANAEQSEDPDSQVDTPE